MYEIKVHLFLNKIAKEQLIAGLYSGLIDEKVCMVAIKG